jgi:hypothetical protein
MAFVICDRCKGAAGGKQFCAECVNELCNPAFTSDALLDRIAAAVHAYDNQPYLPGEYQGTTRQVLVVSDIRRAINKLVYDRRHAKEEEQDSAAA